MLPAMALCRICSSRAQNVPPPTATNPLALLTDQATMARSCLCYLTATRAACASALRQVPGPTTPACQWSPHSQQLRY